MITASRAFHLGGLLLLAGLSLGVMFFVFEFHYMWYLKPSQAWMLRAGFAVGMIALTALWTFFPSYWAVATVSVIVFLFPVFVPDISPSPLSARLAITMTVSIVLLIATTALRRHWFPLSTWAA